MDNGTANQRDNLGNGTTEKDRDASEQTADPEGTKYQDSQTQTVLQVPEKCHACKKLEIMIKNQNKEITSLQSVNKRIQKESEVLMQNDKQLRKGLAQSKENVNTLRKELNQSIDGSQTLIKTNQTLANDLEKAKLEIDRLIAICLEHGVNESMIHNTEENIYHTARSQEQNSCDATTQQRAPLHTENMFSVLIDEYSDESTEDSCSTSSEGDVLIQTDQNWRKQGAKPKQTKRTNKNR